MSEESDRVTKWAEGMMGRQGGRVLMALFLSGLTAATTLGALAVFGLLPSPLFAALFVVVLVGGDVALEFVATGGPWPYVTAVATAVLWLVSTQALAIGVAVQWLQDPLYSGAFKVVIVAVLLYFSYVLWQTWRQILPHVRGGQQ